MVSKSRGCGHAGFLCGHSGCPGFGFQSIRNPPRLKAFRLRLVQVISRWITRQRSLCSRLLLRFYLYFCWLSVAFRDFMALGLYIIRNPAFASHAMPAGSPWNVARLLEPLHMVQVRGLASSISCIAHGFLFVNFVHAAIGSYVHTPALRRC